MGKHATIRIPVVNEGNAQTRALRGYYRYDQAPAKAAAIDQ
jgi:hypothetical protein